MQAQAAVNQRQILRVLTEQGRLSVSQIADAAQMSKTTAQDHLYRLADEGEVTKDGSICAPHTGGRNPTAWTLADEQRGAPSPAECQMPSGESWRLWRAQCDFTLGEIADRAGLAKRTVLDIEESDATSQIQTARSLLEVYQDALGGDADA